MKTNKLSGLAAIALCGVLAAACGAVASATPEATPGPVTDVVGAVLAEGRLVPKDYRQLAFTMGGQLVEVLVAQGDVVAAGDVLARLGNAQDLSAVLDRAQLEQLNAQQALDALNDNAGKVRAAAQSELAIAEDKLERANRKLRNLKAPDVAYYERELRDAQFAYTKAQQNTEAVDLSASGSAKNNLDAATENQKDAQKRYDKVVQAVNGCTVIPNPKYKNLTLVNVGGATYSVGSDQKLTLITDPDIINDPTKQCDANRKVTVEGVSQSLEEATNALNGARDRTRLAQIAYNQGQMSNTTALDKVAQDLEDAENRVRYAKEAPKNIDVALAVAEGTVAQATIDDAKRRLADMGTSGPNKDDLKLIETRLAQATAAVANAEANLADNELRAPIAGEVVRMALKVGEFVQPGLALVTLAQADDWEVLTDNLTEIEVPQVSVGQAVTIVPDALPDIELIGKVTEISQLFEEKRGDITYTVKVALADSDPRLLWGMTVLVAFPAP